MKTLILIPLVYINTYNQVRNLKSELVRKGIIEAKVVPYLNDQVIEIDQIESLKETFSDLNEYLKFESE